MKNTEVNSITTTIPIALCGDSTVELLGTDNGAKTTCKKVTRSWTLEGFKTTCTHEVHFKASYLNKEQIKGSFLENIFKNSNITNGTSTFVPTKDDTIKYSFTSDLYSYGKIVSTAVETACPDPLDKCPEEYYYLDTLTK